MAEEKNKTEEQKDKETKEQSAEEKESSSAKATEDKEKEPAAPAKVGKEASQEEGEEVEIPAKFKDIVEKIENMSVLDLNELVKLLEKKFGVSAAAVAAPAAGVEAGPAEEKDTFTVELTSDGGAKIPVMKVIKEILGLGLKEAKDLVEGVPSVLKEEVKKAEAEEMKKKIEEAGGKVELK